MASEGPLGRQRQSRNWAGHPSRQNQRWASVTSDDILLGSPWLLRFAFILLIPVMGLKLVSSYYSEFTPEWVGAQPYEVAYRNTTLDLSSMRDFSFNPAMPWPRYERGRLGWYRQGLREVATHRHLIERLTEGQELGIILAAAVANQGNSIQRPWGWTGAEHLQAWLGQTFDWPWPQWRWGRERWRVWFEQYSVGVGQMTPQEAERLGYQLHSVDLLVDQISIELMLEKLLTIQLHTKQAGLERNDALVLLMIANNSDLDLVRIFQASGLAMDDFLTQNPFARRQLAKMLTYIDYLHTHEDWPLPAGIDWQYVLSLARA
jgi:CheY-like chemotaxis protein